MGMTGLFSGFPSSYLQGRSQRVEVDKVLSSPLVIASGVPQGSIFGPSALYIVHK